MEDIDTADITNPIGVAQIAFGNDDGVILGDITFQSYVMDTGDGHVLADVCISDIHLEGGGPFRYRTEYIGPALEPPGPSSAQ